MPTRKRRSRKGAGKPAPFVFARAIPGSRKTMGEGFARRVSPTTIDADIDLNASWEQWRHPGWKEDPSASKRRNVRRILKQRDVQPETIDKIVNGMDPTQYYLVEIYGVKGSKDLDDGDVVVKQAMYTGQGERLWSKLIGYASVAPIDDVEIRELAFSSNTYPLWGHDSIYGPGSVITIDGERVYGHGQMEEWRDRQKKGPPKKSGGGRNAKQRRAYRKAKNAAIARKQKIKAKIKKLRRKGDHAAARALERKSESRRTLIY